MHTVCADTARCEHIYKMSGLKAIHKVKFNFVLKFTRLAMMKEQSSFLQTGCGWTIISRAAMEKGFHDKLENNYFVHPKSGYY